MLLYEKTSKKLLDCKNQPYKKWPYKFCYRMKKLQKSEYKNQPYKKWPYKFCFSRKSDRIKSDHMKSLNDPSLVLLKMLNARYKIWIQNFKSRGRIQNKSFRIHNTGFVCFFQCCAPRAEWSCNYLRPGAGDKIIFLINTGIYCSQFGGC